MAKCLSLIGIILIIQSIGIQARAQENTLSHNPQYKNRYAIWFIPSTANNIYGLAIGPVGSEAICNRPYIKSSHGINIQVIGQGIFQMFYISNLNETDLLSIDSSVKKDQVGILAVHNGLLLSAFGTFTSRINGLSISPWMSMGDQVNGISLNLLWNLYREVNGISMGLFNDTGKTRGVQIGLFNKTNRLRGIQIGLWNKNEKRSLPLINWNF
ncbi:MAG: hypothetical protein U5Q03_02790 [Bacteroidota bacterium]|nr:hypothetical protein [Bacteroidota bacterium]